MQLKFVLPSTLSVCVGIVDTEVHPDAELQANVTLIPVPEACNLTPHGRSEDVRDCNIVPRWTTVGSMNEGSKPSPTVGLSSYGDFERDLCHKCFDQSDGKLAYVPHHYWR